MKKRTPLILIALATLVLATGCQHMKARCENCGKVIKVTTLRGVHFDFDKYAIKPEGVPVLQEDINLLNSDATLDISIEGHTDNIGSEAYNMQLSKRRAQAIYDYFIKNGISANRMNTVGFGKSRPITPNTGKSSRALNRRVEIHVIKVRP
jgi:OOP family OmpA-OmpF porin